MPRATTGPHSSSGGIRTIAGRRETEGKRGVAISRGRGQPGPAARPTLRRGSRASGRLLGGALGDGVPRGLPRREAAVHLGDAGEPHLLGGVGGTRGSPRAVAVEDELLAGGEHVLEVRALRIDPELEHAAGAVEGAGDHPLPLEFPDVAEIDEDDVALAVSGPGLLQLSVRMRALASSTS